MLGRTTAAPTYCNLLLDVVTSSNVQINTAALRVIRERSGLSVTALAEAAGIKQAHLSNIEAGRRKGSPEVVTALAAALKIPLVAILGDVA